MKNCKFKTEYMNNEFEHLFSGFSEVSTQEWKDKIIIDLKGADYNKLVTKTDFGSDFQPFYQENDIKSIPFIKNIPAEFPFLRGTEPENNWKIRQEIVVNDIVEANNFAIKLLENGVNSIVFCFNDRHISEVADLTMLLEGIDISKTEISFKNQDNILQLQELFILFTELKSIDITKLKGSFYYNPITKFISEGVFPIGENQKFDNVNILVNLNIERLGNYGAINVDADLFHNAGANTVQEIAFALSQGVEYINKFTNNEPKNIENLTKQLEFTFATSSNYFIEIAKYRAVKLLWAKIIESYGVQEKELQKIRINAITSTWNKTSYDAYVNLLRTTTEAMAATIGGCKSITVIPFDSTFKYPDDFSYRIAKNIQIVLKEESYLNKVVDPAGGSYYIETLTNELINKSWQLFLETENEGGFCKNILNNKIQNLIEESANEKNVKIALGKISILGTNKYPNLLEKINGKIKIETETEITISDYPFKKIKTYRAAEKFEQLRLKTESLSKIPKVFLFNIGNVTMSKARSIFALSFFGCAGFEIIDNDIFKTVDEGLIEITKHKPEIVVICSSDDEYLQLAKEIKPKLNKKIEFVIAGYPKNIVDELKAIGVNNFIHVNSNILETLTNFQNRILE